MSTSHQTYPIHKLPLPPSTFQQALPRLDLENKPTAQRRSTTFKSDTPGIWARVNPLWTSWPLRITKEEILEMGADVDKGEKIDVEDILRRWDPIDEVSTSLPSNGLSNGPHSDHNHMSSPKKGETSKETGLRLWSSQHRSQLRPILLGISPKAVRDTLPHLDMGDAARLCSPNPTTSSTQANSAEADSRNTLLDVLSGRKVVATNSNSEEGYGPWSTRYCGHQFGVWAGQLGDGRAISILETTSSGVGRQEIQLKGAGRTPFSRSADGLAVLRSGVREYLGGEAIAALGIPTTRSLALLTTPNLPVLREEGPEPPSLLARVAPSFLRIGHFEALNPGEAGRNTRQIFFGGSWAQDSLEMEGPLEGGGNLSSLGKLANWCKDLTGSLTIKEWVEEVIKRNAEMVAKWQVYGFCHGVLNSDNISVLGLTVDYGPYAFMDVFNESHICNHSDPTGLYSYKNQPSRVLFALDKLVSAVSPLIGYETEHGSLKDGWEEGATKDDVEKWKDGSVAVMSGWEETFWQIEKEEERSGWLRRFGLKTYTKEDDRDVLFDFLTLLRTYSLDLNLTFRHLSHFSPSKATTQGESYIRAWTQNMADECIADQRNDAVNQAVDGLQIWLRKYAARVSAEAENRAWQHQAVEGGWEDARQREMLSINPKFILRQWVLEELIQQLESIDLEVEESIAEGRVKLAKILDMATRPFEPWGEDGNTDEERLCGIGAKEMLGFQCSCSS